MSQATRRLRVSATGAVVAAAAWLCPAVSAQPLNETLDQLPSGAEVVVVIPSLSKLNDAVAQFNRDMELGIPQLNNPLALMKGMAGFSEGFNDDGAAVLIIPSLSEAIANDDEPEPILLLPVSDYAAFAESMGGTAQGVSAMPLAGEEGFAKKTGAFAVFAEEQEVVDQYAAGMAGQAMLAKVGEYAGQYSGSSLALVIVDIEAMAPTILSKLDEAMAEMAQEMENAAPMDMSGMLEMMEGTAKEFISNTKTVTMGLDMERGGVGMTMSVNFKPGSELAALLPGSKGSAQMNDALMRQLPDSSYIVSGVVDFGAIDFAKVTSLMEAMADNMAGVPMFEGVAEMMLEAMPMYENAEGMAQSLYTMPPMQLMSGQGMKTVSVMRVKDAETYADSYEKVLKSVADGMGKIIAGAAEMSGGEVDAESISFDSTYEANALEVDGVRVDKYSMSMQAPPEVMEQLQAANPMASAGMNTEGFIAYVGKNTVVTTTMPDEALLRESIASAQESAGIGTSTALAAARLNDMPKNAFAEGYLSLGGVAEMVGNFMMGDPTALPVPENLPPVSVGVGAQEGQVVGRIYLPLDTIRFVKDTAMMFMGGGNKVSAPVPAE